MNLHTPPQKPAGDASAGTDRHRAMREAVLIGACACLAAGLGVLGLWIAASATIREDYAHYLTSLARVAARQVDPELHRSLQHPSQQNGEDYLRAVAPLRNLRSSLPDVRFIYTMVRDGDQYRFVLDAAMPGDHDGDGVHDQAGLGEIYQDADPAMLTALGTPQRRGEAASTDQPYGDKWGSFMTGWAPLVDDAGRQFGALGIDVDASLYMARLQRARFWALMGLLPAALFILLLSAAFYHVRQRAIAATRAAERVARELSTEQRRLHNVIEGTNVGAWEASLDPQRHEPTVITVDARWAAMLGHEAADLNPLPAEHFFRTLVHPDDAAPTRGAITEALREEGRMFEIDVRMRHRAGHWVWTSVRGKVIERDAAGRPLHMVGTQVDTSARKQIELALMESESNFRSLFELSPVGICLADMHSGRFLAVNDSLVASTGYSREELLRLSYWDITPGQWHTFERGQLAVLERNTHFGTYEKEYQRKNGSRYPVLISGTRMRDASGREVIWAIVQDISERKAMESQLAIAAQRDRLTGLSNRACFHERLQAAVERVRDGRQARFAVLFLDFDRFKLINDAMGHEAGDALLRAIAERIRHAVGDGEPHPAGYERTLAGRFGGDEFLVLVNDLPDADAPRRIAEHLVAVLADPYSVQGRDVYSTASIGYVSSDQGIESAEAAVRNADVAMYEAKRSGRACAVMFDSAMRAQLTRFVTIDGNLRKALGTPELSLVYQPIVALDDRRMNSVEALARWDHPELGQVSPSEFIAVAEESGLITALGQWVLREACLALAEWRRISPAGAPGTVSVNISRVELAQGERLLARVREALDQSGLPPECLRLEVTERDVMRDPTATLTLMRALRELGVQLAMDDFGTGTSSLGCLRDYPFDVIKIDRSFISDVTDSPDVLAMIHAAITLVQNLGKNSVAEGVETAQQVAILQSLGCHHAQGYYFSRPLTHQQMCEAIAPATSRQARAAR